MGHFAHLGGHASGGAVVIFILIVLAFVALVRS
jgi:hypothetical protein